MKATENLTILSIYKHLFVSNTFCIFTFLYMEAQNPTLKDHGKTVGP